MLNVGVYINVNYISLYRQFHVLFHVIQNSIKHKNKNDKKCRNELALSSLFLGFHIHDSIYCRGTFKVINV